MADKKRLLNLELFLGIHEGIGSWNLTDVQNTTVRGAYPIEESLNVQVLVAVS